MWRGFWFLWSRVECEAGVGSNARSVPRQQFDAVHWVLSREKRSISCMCVKRRPFVRCCLAIRLWLARWSREIVAEVWDRIGCLYKSEGCLEIYSFIWDVYGKDVWLLLTARGALGGSVVHSRWLIQCPSLLLPLCANSQTKIHASIHVHPISCCCCFWLFCLLFSSLVLLCRTLPSLYLVLLSHNLSLFQSYYLPFSHAWCLFFKILFQCLLLPSVTFIILPRFFFPLYRGTTCSLSLPWCEPLVVLHFWLGNLLRAAQCCTVATF